MVGCYLAAWTSLSTREGGARRPSLMRSLFPVRTLQSAIPMSQTATLPDRINSATRRQHTELNRLLIHRLPLALPPHVQTPFLYGAGIIPFAGIFMLFEAEWELLSQHFHRNSKVCSRHEYELQQWLTKLRPEGLPRSHRLRSDMSHLRSMEGASIYTPPALGDMWMAEMRDLLRTKPHVLVAFAWVFYMAVFSGGRWIRQQLANSGADFWTRQRNARSLDKASQLPLLEIPGFTFLSFDGEQDGEDMKALFKARLTDADWLLSEQEKQDVINVAQRLFDRNLELVTELDRMVYRRKILSWTFPFLLATLLLGFVLAVWAGCKGLLKFRS